jgi:hypothetical protein
MKDLKEAIEYEVKCSWWVEYISNPYLRRLAGNYYHWKASRKYKQYLKSEVRNLYVEQLKLIKQEFLNDLQNENTNKSNSRNKPFK